MKIPFDIKYRPQIESGEYKVVTRDGRPARIICWDRFVTEPYDSGNIVALVTGTIESAYYYFQDGYLWNQANKEGDSQLDLFIIIPESKLTELERAIKRGMICAGLEGVSTTIIKETAKEIKDIICKGCSANLEGYIKGRQDTLKEIGDYMQEKFTMGNPFIQKLDPNVVIDTTTSGTCKKD